MILPTDAAVWRRIDQAFRNRATWSLTFAWWPQRCEFSHQCIWFKLAYRGTAVRFEPGEAVYEHRWATREQYLIARLKGTV